MLAGRGGLLRARGSSWSIGFMDQRRLGSRDSVVLSGPRRPLQRFLVTPHLEWKRAVRYFEVFDHRSGATPTALLVEPRGALVSDRAGKPSRRDTAAAKPSFRIGDQSRGDTRTSRLRGNIELIELIALQHAKADRRAGVAGDAHTGQCGSKPFSETLERTKASEFHRHDSRMRVPPAVVPNLCQRADFRCLGISYDHRGQRLLRLDQRDQFLQAGACTRITISSGRDTWSVVPLFLEAH
jgi:hypothetical protein